MSGASTPEGATDRSVPGRWRRRSRRQGAVTVAASLAALALALAGCGIDGAEVTAGADVATVTTGAPGTTVAATTTSTTDGPSFTLPSIPTGDPNTTQTTQGPETTAPATTQGGSTQVTPHGVSETSFSAELVKTFALTQQKADCVAHSMFTQLTGEQIDQIYEADNEAELDPQLLVKFTSILGKCLATG